MSALAPQLSAPLALWRVAVAFLRTLHMLFGPPEAVASQGLIGISAHNMLSAWLRCAEAMLRRLVLIEAAALPAPAPAKQRPPRQRARRLMRFHPDQPEAWRVSFRVFAPARAKASARTVPARRMLARSAWPLAERYEALLRVINAPMPFAARAARRLHHAPSRLHAALRAPALAKRRVPGFEAMKARAERAWRRRFSSA